MQIPPTIKAPFTAPILNSKVLNPRIMGTTAPRTKLGTVVVTVARILVPNCSEAMVTKRAQYPVAHPIIKQRK